MTHMFEFNVSRNRQACLINMKWTNEFKAANSADLYSNLTPHNMLNSINGYTFRVPLRHSEEFVDLLTQMQEAGCIVASTPSPGGGEAGFGNTNDLDFFGPGLTLKTIENVYKEKYFNDLPLREGAFLERDSEGRVKSHHPVRVNDLDPNYFLRTIESIRAGFEDHCAEYCPELMRPQVRP